jgi:hypothetical protein
MILNRAPKPAAPKSKFVVIAEVQNVHIAGRKVLKGDTIDLSEAEAAHWLVEGVIERAPAEPANAG